MDTLSSSNSNSSIVNGEKCSVSEEQWKAEKAIGGNAQALQALRELIVFPLLYSREAQKLGLKWPRGLLLYGPPGTGKTSLVEYSGEDSCYSQDDECPKVEGDICRTCLRPVGQAGSVAGQNSGKQIQSVIHSTYKIERQSAGF